MSSRGSARPTRRPRPRPAIDLIPGPYVYSFSNHFSHVHRVAGRRLGLALHAPLDFKSDQPLSLSQQRAIVSTCGPAYLPLLLRRRCLWRSRRRCRKDAVERLVRDRPLRVHVRCCLATRQPHGTCVIGMAHMQPVPALWMEHSAARCSKASIPVGSSSIVHLRRATVEPGLSKRTGYARTRSCCAASATPSAALLSCPNALQCHATPRE
jgi:hypothetical protein